MTNRAIGYVRVRRIPTPTDTIGEARNVVHVADRGRQIHAITEYCEQNGIALLAIHGDRGTQGANLEHVLSELEKGRANVLVVHRLDRLARTGTTILRLLQAAQRQNWRLVVLDPPFDSGTVAGQMAMQIFTAMIAMEIEEADPTQDD